MMEPQALALAQQQQPAVRTVNPGDRVNIPCSLANMGGSIQFAKDEQAIILDSGCAHCQLDISNEGQASLTINRVGRRDQGLWQCWRLDAAGKVKQKIPIVQLQVTNSPELPILIVNDKELLGDNSLDQTITVKENEPVTFRCVIKGASQRPVDYVHWMLDSSQNLTQMSQLMMEYSPLDGNYLTQSVLKLQANKTMNLKSISCLSQHQLWLTPKTVTAFLNVLYEPSFIISREPGFGVAVSEGMSVMLKCEIDSNPSSAPIWIKDADNKTASAANSQLLSSGQVTTNGKEAAGEPIVLESQEDGSLVFQPAQQADSGWYRCKTENKYGNFSSFGYYLNVRPHSSSSSSALSPPPPPPPLGTTNQPPSAGQQHRYGGPQAPASSRVMAPNQPAAQTSAAAAAAHQLLQHQRLVQSGAAGNSNIMNNDQPFLPTPALPYGQAQAQATGCGAGRPEIDQPVSVVSAVLGRQLVLPLRFCCNPGPTRVFWIHRHLAMIPGRMFGPYITRDIYSTYNSVYCYESTFEIESVKLEDIGTVYVFVSNEKGHAGAQIHIQLSKSSQPTTASHDDHTADERPPIGARFPLSAGSGAAGPVLVNNLLLLSTAVSAINWLLVACLTTRHNR